MGRTAQEDRPKQDEKPAASAGSGADDACRCKETAEMKPGELLKLMISDLAFWKKGKKRT